MRLDSVQPATIVPSPSAEQPAKGTLDRLSEGAHAAMSALGTASGVALTLGALKAGPNKSPLLKAAGLIATALSTYDGARRVANATSLMREGRIADAAKELGFAALNATAIVQGNASVAKFLVGKAPILEPMVQALHAPLARGGFFVADGHAAVDAGKRLGEWNGMSTGQRTQALLDFGTSVANAGMSVTNIRHVAPPATKSLPYAKHAAEAGHATTPDTPAQASAGHRRTAGEGVQMLTLDTARNESSMLMASHKTSSGPGDAEKPEKVIELPERPGTAPVDTSKLGKGATVERQLDRVSQQNVSHAELGPTLPKGPLDEAISATSHHGNVPLFIAALVDPKVASKLPKGPFDEAVRLTRLRHDNDVGSFINGMSIRWRAGIKKYVATPERIAEAERDLKLLTDFRAKWISLACPKNHPPRPKGTDWSLRAQLDQPRRDIAQVDRLIKRIEDALAHWGAKP